MKNKHDHSTDDDMDLARALNPRSYFVKESVYGDEPLIEIIYEIEDRLVHDDKVDGKYVTLESLYVIFERHKNTVQEISIFQRKVIIEEIKIKLLERGHGGGNWRRIIEQLR